MGRIKEQMIKDEEAEFHQMLSKRAIHEHNDLLKELEYKLLWGPLSNKTVEIINGEYRTIVDIRFDENGFPIAVTHKAEAILSDNQQKQNQLEELIKQAVENKDFRAAESLQKQLDSLNLF